jgi:hypothetical protein
MYIAWLKYIQISLYRSLIRINQAMQCIEKKKRFQFELT